MFNEKKVCRFYTNVIPAFGFHKMCPGYGPLVSEICVLPSRNISVVGHVEHGEAVFIDYSYPIPAPTAGFYIVEEGFHRELTSSKDSVQTSR